MNWQDAALTTAGVIGSGVAVVHGVLVQRLMVAPFGQLSLGDNRITPPVRRLMPPLLHFSTISWFLGGLALIAAASWFGTQAKLATGLFVGGSYLLGALANLWGTRGRHPDWILYTIAILLIIYGVA